MRLRTKLMKSLLFTTMILLFSTTLFGCEKTTNVNVNVKEKAEEMTKMETETMNDIQFMMEKYGLSEEEMQGLDAAKLISDFQLRSRDYTPEDIREILAAEGDMYILDEEARLFRIFSAEGGKLEEGRTDIVRTALYLNAARAGKHALAICTVSDHILTGEATTAEERQLTFTKMMDVAFSLI